MNKPKLCYKYADRSAKNSCEKAISDLGKMKQFDMNIGTTDTIIGGHRFVLAMFSKYFRDVTTTAPPQTMIFTRIEFPSKLVSGLLELFYESSVIIDAEDREPFESLLKQMKVGDVKRSVVTDTNRSLGAKIEMARRVGGNGDMRSIGRPIGGVPMHTGLEIRRQVGGPPMQMGSEIRPIGRMAGSLKHKQEVDKKSTIFPKIDITPARVAAENNAAVHSDNGSNNGSNNGVKYMESPMMPRQSDNGTNNGVKYMESPIMPRQRNTTPVDSNLGEFNPSIEPIKNEAEEEDSSESEEDGGGDGDAQSESGSDEMDMDSECSRKQNA